MPRRLHHAALAIVDRGCAYHPYNGDASRAHSRIKPALFHRDRMSPRDDHLRHCCVHKGFNGDFLRIFRRESNYCDVMAHLRHAAVPLVGRWCPR